MELLDRGNTAEVFQYGEGKICKLFNEGFPRAAAKWEYENAKIMQEFNLQVPHVYEMIQNEGRVGIIYEQIKGETALGYFLKKNDIGEMVHVMAALHQKILEKHTHKVQSYKDELIQIVKSRKPINETLTQEIMALPDGDCLCHGDLHPGNILIAENGEAVLIDFMNVCYGPWQYDVARSYFLMSCGEVSDETPNKDEIKKMQGQIARRYLEQMGATTHELAAYLKVIKSSRAYES